VRTGTRTFENATRNTLDLSAIPVVKMRSHLPIVVDPTRHGPARQGGGVGLTLVHSGGGQLVHGRRMGPPV
jgi:hypothetical protein